MEEAIEARLLKAVEDGSFLVLVLNDAVFELLTAAAAEPVVKSTSGKRLTAFPST